jgi:multiple sugar transport system permease protein
MLGSQIQTGQPPAKVKAKPKLSIGQRLWRDRWIYIFLLPSVVLYGLFTLWPILTSYWYSLLDWDGFDPNPRFIGLDNYAEVVQDPLFWRAFGNSFLYMALVVPFRVGPALIVALILSDKRLPFVKFFRTAFFLPVVTTTAIIGVMATFLLDPGGGPINLLLMKSGLVQRPVDFLGSNIGIPTAAGVDVWKWFGLTLIYWLAALQTVPEEVREAAKVDGANSSQILWFVTLPILKPFALIIVLITALGALHSFDLILTLTGGGPALSTEVVELYIYRWAFTASIPRLGYASAAAVFFGLATLLIALLQFAALRKTQSMRGSTDE